MMKHIILFPRNAGKTYMRKLLERFRKDKRFPQSSQSLLTYGMLNSEQKKEYEKLKSMFPLYTEKALLIIVDK